MDPIESSNLMSKTNSTCDSGSLISTPSLSPWLSHSSGEAPPLSSEFGVGSAQISVHGFEWHGTQKKFSKPYDMHLRTLEIVDGKFEAEGVDG